MRMHLRSGGENCAILQPLRHSAERSGGISADAPRGRWQSGIAVALAAATLVVFVNALCVAQRLAQTSDSANGFVIGHAIAGGNILLSGWHFPLDDYYFTDALPYAVLEWLLGPRPFLLVLVPSLTYAFFLLAALLACRGRGRTFAANLAGGATITLLLGAPPWIGSWNPVLMSDMHAATVLAAFIVLVLCARIATSELASGAIMLIPVIACLTVASDPFALVFAFGPALAILAIEAIRRRDSRGARLAFMLLAAGTCAGLVLPWAVAQMGGFTIENDVLTRFVPLALLARNLIAVLAGTLTLFGTNLSASGAGFGNLLLAAMRGIGLILAAVAVLRVIWRAFMSRGTDLLDRLLCAGILTVLVACTSSAQFAKGITPQTLWAGGPPMRFLVPAWLFSAALAGRQMQEILSTIGSARIRNAAPAALALCAAILVSGGYWLSGLNARPPWIASNPPTAVARWLMQHHLFQGVGEYWSANLVTAMSGNAVQVRSVVPNSDHLVPYVWVEDARWYARSPQFVIWQDHNKTGITWEQIRATYPVYRRVTVADYLVALLSSPP